MCGVYWAKDHLDKAEILMDSVPKELKESLPYYLLKGKSLSHETNTRRLNLFSLDL
jgi:hypothetical protein